MHDILMFLNLLLSRVILFGGNFEIQNEPNERKRFGLTFYGVGLLIEQRCIYRLYPNMETFSQFHLKPGYIISTI